MRKYVIIVLLVLSMLICTMLIINNAYSAQYIININTATFEELKTLPGIGDILAQRIIENRPYKSVYDLNAVKGIGDIKIRALERLVKTE